MRDLLSDPTFSDFKIVCEGRTFHCHKNIVASKSDVLMTMLLSEDWTENKKDTLLIEDFISETVEQMLHFVYTGELPTFRDEYTVSLLHIGNKYNIKRDKHILSKTVLSNFRPKQASELIEDPRTSLFELFIVFLT
jgi:hypothetical protein